MRGKRAKPYGKRYFVDDEFEEDTADAATGDEPNGKNTGYGTSKNMVVA
jgi:hypothetical protein